MLFDWMNKNDNDNQENEKDDGLTVEDLIIIEELLEDEED